jgi:hypothetical protein
MVRAYPIEAPWVSKVKITIKSFIVLTLAQENCEYDKGELGKRGW